MAEQRDGMQVTAADVVVITGGTRGIGAATARLLAARGHGLVLGYRDDRAAAEVLADELRRSVEVGLVRADLAHEWGVVDLFAAADRCGRLVGLVNNAAVLEQQSRLEEIDRAREEWRSDRQRLGLALEVASMGVRVNAVRPGDHRHGPPRVGG